MSRNGSGVYNLPAANYPAVSGTAITAANRNAIDADIATALTGSIAVNGESVITGNIPMGGNKFTGLSNGSASSDSAAFGQIATAITANNASYLALAGGSLTGLLNVNDGSDIASATTVDLTAATGNTVRITGTTPITAFTMNAGQQMELVAVGALPLTYHATTMNINGGASYTCAANDRLSVFKDGSGVIQVNVTKQDGTAVVAGSQTSKILSISASVGASALTISASALTLDFRSATLTSGTVTTVTGTPANLVISSGSTLGTVNAIQSRLVILALNNAGTIELAVSNISGGVNLDETGVITTTAEGGAGGADSATVVYSTTARTSVAYRVIGFIDSTQATAGTWATAPSTIQGYGGQALAAMSSLGYSQNWQNVTGSRALSTTYTNTTGKPIFVAISLGTSGTSTHTFVIGGSTVMTTTAVASSLSAVNFFYIIPNGVTYSATSSAGAIGTWFELRN